MIERFTGRDVTPEELKELAHEMAGRPERWEHLVQHDAGPRHFAQLHLDEHIGVWLLCWMPGHDTGFHDHDISSGAFTTVRGRLIEERPRFGTDPDSIVVAEGESVSFTPSDIHRVVNLSHEPAVSIHAYSPPLARMGSYLLSPGGSLRRVPIGPTDELRPLAAAA